MLGVLGILSFFVLSNLYVLTFKCLWVELYAISTLISFIVVKAIYLAKSDTVSMPLFAIESKPLYTPLIVGSTGLQVVNPVSDRASHDLVYL